MKEFNPNIPNQQQTAPQNFETDNENENKNKNADIQEEYQEVLHSYYDRSKNPDQLSAEERRALHTQMKKTLKKMEEVPHEEESEIANQVALLEFYINGDKKTLNIIRSIINFKQKGSRSDEVTYEKLYKIADEERHRLIRILSNENIPADIAKTIKALKNGLNTQLNELKSLNPQIENEPQSAFSENDESSKQPEQSSRWLEEKIEWLEGYENLLKNPGEFPVSQDKLDVIFGKIADIQNDFEFENLDAENQERLREKCGAVEKLTRAAQSQIETDQQNETQKSIQNSDLNKERFAKIRKELDKTQKRVNALETKVNRTAEEEKTLTDLKKHEQALSDRIVQLTTTESIKASSEGIWEILKNTKENTSLADLQKISVMLGNLSKATHLTQETYNKQFFENKKTMVDIIVQAAGQTVATSEQTAPNKNQPSATHPQKEQPDMMSRAKHWLGKLDNKFQNRFPVLYTRLFGEEITVDAQNQKEVSSTIRLHESQKRDLQTYLQNDFFEDYFFRQAEAQQTYVGGRFRAMQRIIHKEIKRGGGEKKFMDYLRDKNTGDFRHQTNFADYFEKILGADQNIENFTLQDIQDIMESEVRLVKENNNETQTASTDRDITQQ